MNRRKLTTFQISWMAVCIVLGMVSKKIVSPVTNVLTDFIRLPGGSAAAAFSLIFIVIGAAFVEFRFAGALMGFIQGTLAFCLGIAGLQGPFAFVTFMVPGLAVDAARRIFRTRGSDYFVIATAAANVCSALISDLLVFRFTGRLLLLWVLIAACSGVLAGWLGSLLSAKLRKIPDLSGAFGQGGPESIYITDPKEEKMRNKSRKRYAAALIVLFIATFVTACSNRAASEPAPAVTIVSGGAEIAVDREALAQTEFSGTLVNGKGESSDHTFTGIALADLLAANDVAVTEDATVTVTSSDNYSADFTGAEILEEGKVYIITVKDGEFVPGIDDGTEGAEIVVFGDENSKRCVRFAEKIEVH